MRNFKLFPMILNYHLVEYLSDIEMSTISRTVLINEISEILTLLAKSLFVIPI